MEGLSLGRCADKRRAFENHGREDCEVVVDGTTEDQEEVGKFEGSSG